MSGLSALSGTTFLIVLILSIPLAFLLSVVLFRAACDLCTVEPPGFLKSCAVVILVGLVCAPVAAAVGFGCGLLGEKLHQPPLTMQVVAAFACVPPCALVVGALYIPLLRVRFLKGTTIYVIQWLLGSLVGLVFILLTVGVITIVQGVYRLA